MKLIKEKKIYTGNGVIENGYIRFDEKIEEVGDMAGFEPKEGDLEVSCAGTMVVPGFIDIHRWHEIPFSCGCTGSEISDCRSKRHYNRRNTENGAYKRR